jgi:hypothetical protein
VGLNKNDLKILVLTGGEASEDARGFGAAGVGFGESAQNQPIFRENQKKCQKKERRDPRYRLRQGI